jgi:hypothetical protein
MLSQLGVIKKVGSLQRQRRMAVSLQLIKPDVLRHQQGGCHEASIPGNPDGGNG